MAKASSLIPLIVLFAVIGAFAFVGYHVYLWSTELADRGQKHLEKKNISYSKDGGVRVGVKEQASEGLGDRTQKAIVNTWNNAELPNYKSRLGWNKTQADPKKDKKSS